MMKPREVTYAEYLEFVKEHRVITIDDQEIVLEPIEIKRLTPSNSELTDISTTVWSFPERGSWATHRGDYRGNWAPQIPRALMEMYTRPGDLVLDPMIGSGTTCIEARLLGRNCIGVDISYEAIMLSLHRLYWLENQVKNSTEASAESMNVSRTWSRIYHGDARYLEMLGDNSVDLVATHPPYWNIIGYSHRDCKDGDLSCANTIEDYLKLISDIAKELYRVLKPGGYLGILIGDTRIHKHYVPISHHVLDILMRTGFILKEEVIKIQHKMKTTREIWRRIGKRDFLLIYHEKLYILRKPIDEQDLRKHRYSSGYFRDRNNNGSL
ncbi:MAG: DNA methyltransferase [Desulfurococcaceae archaeon]